MQIPEDASLPDHIDQQVIGWGDLAISRFYERFVRPVLFERSLPDPEIAHRDILTMLAIASSNPLFVSFIEKIVGAGNTRIPTEAFGLTFPNPVGLSAGFAKNGEGLPALAALGFGFIECGTVTYHPQSGNPRPRIVRLVEDEALINAMGFNNDGARALANRLAKTSLNVPVGISLGKSKVTPLAVAVEDYRASLALLYPNADYIAINVSSPNTPGLRNLQESGRLRELISAVQAQMHVLSAGGKTKPLLVKFSPDMNDQDLHDALDVCMELGVDGIIAVNTSISKDGLKPTDQDLINAPGGLSGRPIHTRAVQVVSEIYRYTEGRVPIIGVGGIFCVEDAERMLDHGARLVQLYTGMVYEGPTLPGRIVRGLHARIR